jgi:hypothetical protein
VLSEFLFDLFEEGAAGIYEFCRLFGFSDDDFGVLSNLILVLAVEDKKS